MRKKVDGLSGLVRNDLGRDPCSGDVFVFLNRSLNYLKLLHWKRGGLVLYYKRVGKGTFASPVIRDKSSSLQRPNLVLMVEGIQVKKCIQKPRFAGFI